MTNLLRNLWNDDQGAIISVEWILIVGVLIFGLIPGLVALRNQINAQLTTIGNILMAISPNFIYSGFGVSDMSGSNPVAEVGGFYTTSTSPTYITSYAVAPVPVVGQPVYVDPAP